MAYIYHIVNPKTKVAYIGQASGKFYTRVKDHFNFIYGDKDKDDTNQSNKHEDNEETKELLKSVNLSGFEIKIFSESDNYGFNPQAFAIFLDIFEPEGLRFSNRKFKLKTDQQGNAIEGYITVSNQAGKTQQISDSTLKLDIAEILHIANYKNFGYSKITNDEIGGGFSKWNFIQTGDVAFTKKMLPSQCLAVFNSLGTQFNRVQDIINKAAQSYFVKARWREYFEDELIPYIQRKAVNGLTNKTRFKKNTRMHQLISSHIKNFFQDETTIRTFKNHILKHAKASNYTLEYNFYKFNDLITNMSNFMSEVLYYQIDKIKNLVGQQQISSYKLAFYDGQDFTFHPTLIFNIDTPNQNWWQISNALQYTLVPKNRMLQWSKGYFQSIYDRCKNSKFYEGMTLTPPKIIKSETDDLKNDYINRITRKATKKNWESEHWKPTHVLNVGVNSLYAIGFPSTPSSKSLQNKIREKYKEILNPKADLFTQKNFEEFYIFMINNTKKSIKWKSTKNLKHQDAWDAKDAYYTTQVQLPSSFHPEIRLYLSYHFAYDPTMASKKRITVF